MHFFSVIVQVVGVKNQVKKIVVVKDHPKIEAGMYYYQRRSQKDDSSLKYTAANLTQTLMRSI